MSKVDSNIVLIITDQLPYPPRNGITLPVYNYAIGLTKISKVKIILLVDAATNLDQRLLRENEAIFGKFTLIGLHRSKFRKRLVDEVLQIEMLQHGWTYKNEGYSFLSHHADTLIVSPMSAVAKWRSVASSVNVTANVSIAAVNDCTTAEYYFRGTQKLGGLKSYIKGKIDRLRSHQIGKIEEKLLSEFNFIFLQTETDRSLFSQLVSKELSKKVVVVPNGVNPDLLSITPSMKKQVILFVAELSGEYGITAKWLACDLWPKISAKRKECLLHIIGKGAPEELKSIFRNTEGISHTEFVEDLCDIYKSATIVLSPVFKGFGLINKTLEAMASSVPVVGGAAAFNGIAGFKDKIHGMVCSSQSSDEFNLAISELLDNPAYREKVGALGRELISIQFQWDNAVKKIQDLSKKSLA
jgi:glycosyltransferase involved in cell wall biosynthesis